MLVSSAQRYIGDLQNPVSEQEQSAKAVKNSIAIKAIISAISTI